MANPPRSAEGGFCTPRKLPRGPNGRALCRRCSTEVPKSRQSFCSQPCIDEWRIRTDPGFAARKVEERDHGVCAICSRDCLALRAELEQQADEESMRLFGDGRRYVHLFGLAEKLPVFAARCEELGLSRHHRTLTRRLWEMDHTVPVVEGGGSCGLENLRTLCFACHRTETAKLATRRAAARKAAANGQ